MRALFAVGIILFVFIMIINILAQLVTSGIRKGAAR